MNGLAVTTPLRTAWDLGRVRWTGEAIAGLDAMFRLGQFSREEFLDGIERFRGMRYVITLRAIGPLADGRSESPGESVLRLRWIETHLGRPVPQVEVWRDGVLLAILDIADVDLRYAVEYDGAEWHTSPEQMIHDAERRLAVSGEDWLIDAFVSADLFGRGANPEAKIRQGIAMAQRMFGAVAL